MASKQFPYYIEDWILWIGNRVDNQGNEIDFPYYRTPPLKLANYDVSFVNRSAETIKEGQGFTERQLSTAVKIITKYRRQILSKISIDPEYLKQETPQKLETREVDRSFSIRKQQDRYEVRFPYNPAMVDAMHKLSARSTGDYAWQSEQRAWHVGLTEANLVLLRDFVTTHKSHSWNMDKATQSDFAAVDAALNNIYAHVPYLEITNHGLAVFNSNPNLDAALKSFDFDQDLANAAFYADNYGLHIGQALTEVIQQQYPAIANILLTSQRQLIEDTKTLEVKVHAGTLEQFMKTVYCDHWIFANYDSRGHSISEIAVNIDVPGEKIFVTNSKQQAVVDIVNDLNRSGKHRIVVLCDNSMLTTRLWNMLLSKNISRLIYMHGGISV
jgi:hypothetical protein